MNHKCSRTLALLDTAALMFQWLKSFGTHSHMSRVACNPETSHPCFGRMLNTTNPDEPTIHPSIDCAALPYANLPKFALIHYTKVYV